jgi:hypothetical protein
MALEIVYRKGKETINDFDYYIMSDKGTSLNITSVI